MDISWLTEDQRLVIEDKFARLLASKAKACPTYKFGDDDFYPFFPLDIMDGSFRGMTYLDHWEEQTRKSALALDTPPDFVFDWSPMIAGPGKMKVQSLEWDKVAMFDINTWRNFRAVEHMTLERLYMIGYPELIYEQLGSWRLYKYDRNELENVWLEEEYLDFGQRLAAQLSIFKKENLTRLAGYPKENRAERRAM